MVSFPEPNTPLICGRESFQRYDVDSIALPENLHDDFAASPAFYRRQKPIQQHMTDRRWRQLRAVYYALITELDQQFGKLMDQLESAAQLQDTIVVVLSDHGRYVGAHGDEGASGGGLTSLGANINDNRHLR